MGGDSPAETGRRDADPALPVGGEEYLLRRIHRNQYEDRPKDPILRTGFTPTKSDTDGLSVYRTSFCTVREVANDARQAPTEYYVVRLRAADVLAAGFNLVPDPLPPPHPAGHTLIPEITYQKAKETKPLQLRLAELANQGRDIVWKLGVECSAEGGS